MRKVVASLDVGTNSIKLIVGEMFKSKLNILSVFDTPSKGIKKGIVVNKDEVVLEIKELLTKTEEMLGLSIEKVMVSIPPYGASYDIEKSEVKTISEDGLITGDDIINALENVSKDKIASNMELINIVPISFNVNKEIVVDPKGMIADNFSLKALLISVPKQVAYSILEAVDASGLEVFDISISPIGDYFANKKDYMDNKIGALVNIGESNTTISVFNKGIITNSNVIDKGGNTLDNDLTYVYNIPKTAAKELKETFLLASTKNANVIDTRTITTKDGKDVTINQYEGSNVIECRLKEILDITKKEINLLTKKEISYIIVTGGVTELPDFKIVLESEYGNQVILGAIDALGVRNNKYSTVYGMIKYFNDKQVLKDKDYSIFSIEEQEELSGIRKKTNLNEDSILGKVFGYFFE